MKERLKRFWSDLPLGSKIASMMSLLVMLAVFSLTLLSIQRERASFRSELLEQADLYLETSSFTLRDSLYNTKLDDIFYISSIAKRNESINAFIVYDKEGKVLVDSRKEGVVFSQQVDPFGRLLIARTSTDMYTEWDADQLRAGKKIVLGKQVLGAISVDFSTIKLNEKLRNITIQGLSLSAVAIIVGALLTVMLSQQITHPLSELNAVVGRMKAGDLNQRVEYSSGDEIGQLSAAFNQMAEQLQEREWLRDMFGRFVSHEVADAIRTGKVNLEGENRTVSVLFCDIREFTDYSETREPHEVVSRLNIFLPLVVHSAQKYGGMVNKFGGDSTLIIFGAPNDVQDNAYKAVMTALEIRNALRGLNTRFTDRGEPPLRVGVGINTGIALAGAIGPEERQEYTVIGSTVNLAARIDGLNKQFPDHDILISGWTYNALSKYRDQFHMVSLGAVPIRGRHEPVEIWAVLGDVN